MRQTGCTPLCVLSLAVTSCAVVACGLLPLGANVHPGMRSVLEANRLGIEDLEVFARGDRKFAQDHERHLARLPQWPS